MHLCLPMAEGHSQGTGFENASGLTDHLRQPANLLHIAARLLLLQHSLLHFSGPLKIVQVLQLSYFPSQTKELKRAHKMNRELVWPGANTLNLKWRSKHSTVWICSVVSVELLKWWNRIWSSGTIGKCLHSELKTGCSWSPEWMQGNESETISGEMPYYFILVCQSGAFPYCVTNQRLRKFWHSLAAFGECKQKTGSDVLIYPRKFQLWETIDANYDRWLCA